MTGRVTMLGISRWTGKGGSYSTIIRFFDTIIDWGEVHWILIKNYLINSKETYLLAGDEVVVTKSGKTSHGLDKFFSSIMGKPVNSLCFFALSLISVEKRKSYPIDCQQVIRPKNEPKSKRKSEKSSKKKRCGIIISSGFYSENDCRRSCPFEYSGFLYGSRWRFW